MDSSIAVLNQIGECGFKEFKNIKELELNKKYKNERFEKIKFGPSILCHLEEYKVYLPKTFVNKLDDTTIKYLNKNKMCIRDRLKTVFFLTNLVFITHCLLYTSWGGGMKRGEKLRPRLCT